MTSLNHMHHALRCTVHLHVDHTCMYALVDYLRGKARKQSTIVDGSTLTRTKGILGIH